MKRLIGSVLGAVLIATGVLVASFVPEPRPARSAPSENRIEICHRTNAKNNPYRRIRVGWGAVQNSGHGGHNGTEFDISDPAGNTSWGDIFFGTRGGTSRDKNWDSGGKAIFGIDSGGLRITPATYSYNGATRTACKGMTASEYMTSETTAAASGGGGRTLSQVLTDLDDQGADEDDATLLNLGYSTFAAWKTANSSKTDAELIAMSQTAEASAPTASTSAATSVGRTTTTVNGSITQNSYSQVLTVYFEYGTDPGLAESTLTTSVGSTTASSASTFSYSRGLTGLTASTVYYFRIYAENSDQSVLLSGPTLSFTTSSKADRTLTLSAFSASYAFDIGTKPTASATATNDDGDTKTYSSSTTSVCTINSSTGLIAFVDSGTCTIGASIAEGTNYSAATAAELSFTITAATRTLSLAETGGAFSASYAFDVGTKPTALATPSEGAGTITYSSSTTSVCTVNSSSGAITFVDSGSCSLTASIAANLGYATASTSSPSTFTISAVTRSISIDSSSYAASYAQDATGPTLTSTVVGGGAGSKTYSSSTTPVCTVNSSSGLVSFVGTGTCTLTATIAANLGYGAATSPSISFSVTAAALTSRTLNLSSPAASYAFSATPPTFTATPTAGVGQGTKSFTSSTTSICTIDSSSGVVSFVDAGTCTIGASITSGGGFAAATATSESFMITAISRSISIDSGSYAASYARNATPPTVTSTVVGGGSGSKSYTSSTTSVCTVTSGGVVTFEDTGTCTLTASIAANLGYGAATSSAISFTITSPGGGGGGGGGGTTTSTTTAATSTTAAPATTTTTIATAVATTTTSTTTTTTSTTTTLAPRRIKICHATASRTNPYVEITVDINGLNGHGDHPGDIIPAPAAGCSRAAIAAATSTTTSSTVVRGRGGTTTTVGPTATVPQRQQITICHATKSATNPYVEITVDLDGLNGHGDHGDDIIPAPAGGCDAKAVKDAAKEAQVVAKKVEAKERITICHATGSESNPYVEITIDVDGLAGHADHEGDIIPAPAGGCSGQALKKVAEVKQQKNNGRITICHATNSATNPFVEITVDMDGLNGHGDHANDIIPAPAEGCPKQVTPDVREKMVRNNERIKICHATGSDTNPYVEITIDTDGLAGHADHPGDIIPAPAEGCGRNAIAKEIEKRSKPNGKITICHATGSARNPYVEITIDADGLAGHGDHLDDIIPAPIGGCGQKQIEERLVDLGIKEPETIDICHATKDPSRPYVKETVAFDSLDGHGQHNGDIVPAPAAGCSCGAIDAALMGKSAPEGSLLDTLSDVNAERNGGAATDLYELVDTKGKKSGSKGGSVTLTPEEDAPSMQLLSATVDDGSVKLNVTSSGVDYNKPSVWQAEGFGAFCWKLEPFGDNDYRYLLPSPSAPPDSRYAGLPYSAVIVKAGSIKESDPDYQVNTLFMNPSGGTEVFADINRNGISDPGGQGGGLLGDKSISHIILCVGEGEFEEVVTTTTTTTSTTVPAGTPTTLAPTTTTTVPTRVMVNACPKPDGDPTPTTTTTTTVPGGATTTTTIGAATTTTAPGATTTTAPGGTTSTTTVAGTTSTTAPGATTTTVGGTTSTTAPGATTTTAPGGTTSTTAPGATTTTVGGTTSTTAPGATTTTAPGGTTSTTAPGGTTSTTAPGATTTTAPGGTTSTTAPGATTTTLPPRSDSPPPLTFDITPPPGQPLPKEATITLVVSTGSDVETMVLTVDLVDFEPQFDYVTFDESAPADTKPDRTLDQLPKTGGPRWTIEQQIGWLLGLFGLLLMSVAVKPARRHRRRRGA